MAGSPTCGKISTGMRWIASAAQRAIAMRATTTVIGLVRAARTRRMVLLARLRNEWLDISGGRGDAQQTAPDSQPRQRIVDLGLREKPLGFRHFVDVSEARLIASGGLLSGRPRSRYFNRRVSCDAAGALEIGNRAIPLGAQINRDLLVASCFGADSSRLRALPGSDRRQFHDREVDAEPNRIVLNVGSEAVQSTEDSAIEFSAGAASIGGSLQIEARKIGARQRPEPGL